ncbi:MAG TPA: hypothetical protein DCQ37_02250 [Desulfobacteraceae bacterium]|nr:hypothetical protein [Desulfobacteraceae bacterium]
MIFSKVSSHLTGTIVVGNDGLKYNPNPPDRLFAERLTPELLAEHEGELTLPIERTPTKMGQIKTITIQPTIQKSARIGSVKAPIRGVIRPPTLNRFEYIKGIFKNSNTSIIRRVCKYFPLLLEVEAGMVLLESIKRDWYGDPLIERLEQEERIKKQQLQHSISYK